jgi:peroxiredoxin
MSLPNDLALKYDEIHSSVPPQVSATLKKVTADHKRDYDPSKAIQPGSRFPDFELSDALGHQVSLQSLLKKGPILISFYRGQWCPYCDLALRALQKHLPEFERKGVTLVAISPQLPDQSLSQAEKAGVKFPVLSDVGNKVAEQVGIAFSQPQEMIDILGHVDWQTLYGDKDFKIPVPSNFLVDRDGIVRNSFVEAGWHERMDPTVALEWVEAL